MGLLRLATGLGILITGIGLAFYLYRILAGAWPWQKGAKPSLDDGDQTKKPNNKQP